MNLLTAKRATVKSLPADAEDRELATRLARGEPGAFDELVERYAARVIGLATRLLGWSRGGDDVAQDVFLAALEKKGAFRGEARLWTYLAAITVNRCRTVRRRRWLHDRLLRAVAPRGGRPSEATAPCDVDETGRAVRAAIALLPTTYREVVILRYLDEMTINQVADVLSLRRNAVEARLSRARKLLEQSLGHLAEEL
jgi:RNA polymerase sigma-70 factor (ECF subfamily)